MITLLLTENERKAAVFALRSDLETIQDNPEEFGDDHLPAKAALDKLENTRNVWQGVPCPVCELYVSVADGKHDPDDKIMVVQDQNGNFAGAEAVHGRCLSEYVPQ